ncbi:MAG: lysylphosphatidylglycerol synthase domain-containing protein, partial [Kineosporiaceae bacterium]
MRFWRRPAVARSLKVLAIVVAVAVPMITLPRLPHLSLWPALAGLAIWTLGKYLLCPLRWHGLSESGRGTGWHLSAYAESELLGLLTPGHVGADLWRIKRLAGIGMARGSAAAEVTVDRLVGAVGLAAFVGLAGAALPVRMLAGVAGLALLLVVAVLVVRRVRPEWIPRRQWPTPGRLARGLALSVAYQASIIALLFGALLATGHVVDPLAVVGAFGASQLAGVVPGPNGASPRDAALALALVGFGA